MIWTETDYIIEGEAVLPELIDELLKKYPNRIKVCFVGYANVDINEKVKDVYDYSSEKNDWLTNEPNHYVERHISNMVEYSKRIEKYGIRYFDTPKNFTQVLNDTIENLLKKE